MKVKDLIELLKDYNEDAEVVLQEDDEGNGYRRIRGADEDFELETDADIYYLSSFGNVDNMAENFEWHVNNVLENLVDVVILY